MEKSSGSDSAPAPSAPAPQSSQQQVDRTVETTKNALGQANPAAAASPATPEPSSPPQCRTKENFKVELTPATSWVCDSTATVKVTAPTADERGLHQRRSQAPPGGCRSA
jgi:hypothetical protein